MLMTHHNSNCRFKTQLQQEKHTHTIITTYVDNERSLSILFSCTSSHILPKTHTCTFPMQTHRQPLFAQGCVWSAKHTLNLWHNITAYPLPTVQKKRSMCILVSPLEGRKCVKQTHAVSDQLAITRHMMLGTQPSFFTFCIFI